jgi:dipeptidyl aminopeptidase/acylaminoacyl peptidase
VPRLRTVALAVVLLVSARAAHAGDGAQKWMTIETQHFVIYYYEPNLEVAKRVAVGAERAHRTLVEVLGHHPAVRTNIVITDDTDGANGFAGVLPRNDIHLYATAPGSISTLNDHDDWLYGLVTHEYTHIVHLDTISGIPYWYNRIFGKTWAPNQIQPRWFIEGLAVYEESKRSSSGRNRNTIFDMFLRGEVLAGKQYGIDAVTTGPFRFPQGNAAYLYGSHFLEYLGDRYGDDKLAKISHEYGRQPVPYGLNRAVERVIGKSWVTLYDEWSRFLERRYALQKQGVLRRGERAGAQRTASGEGNGLPRFTPDGTKIVWQRSDGYTRQQYRAMDVNGGSGDKSSLLVAIEGAQKFALFKDGSGMVLAIGQTYKGNYDYSDLYRYDYATQKLTRLTYGARVAEPDVSPDGTQVAMTVNGSSRQRLAIMSLTDPDPTIEVVWQGSWRWDQAFSPAWSPDGKRIAFTAWTKGGYRDLWIYDLASHTAVELMHDRALDTDPRWSPDGKRLYFTSDRSGIWNVYAMDLDTRRIRQVTNVLDGTFAPDVSPDGKTLVWSGFRPLGYEIFTMPIDESKWLEPEVYVDDRPDSTVVHDDEIPISKPRPYRPLETLLPDRFDYSLGNDSWGNAVTIDTFGADAVGWHSWSLGATYGFARGDVSFGAGWSYDRFWPSLRIGVGRSIYRAGGQQIDGHNAIYDEESWGGTAAIGLPVLRLPGVSSDIGIEYDLNYTRNLTPAPVPNPDVPLPVEPEEGRVAGVTFGWVMSNARRYAFSLGTAEGRSLGLGVRVDHPELGSSFKRTEISWRYQEYIPITKTHIFAIRYQGAISQSDRRRDGQYYLGGLPQQNIANDILNQGRVGITYLRGYKGGVVNGHEYHLLNLEYRAPVWEIEKGIATLPVYVRRMHVAGLFDCGSAFDGSVTKNDVKPSIGASLRLDVVFGYFAPGTFDLGVSRGLASDGITQYWFLLTGAI